MAKPPKINSFTPEKGIWGDTITLNMQNFQLVDLSFSIYFNDKAAKVIKHNDNTIKVIVPECKNITPFISFECEKLKTKSNQTFEMQFSSFTSFYPKEVYFGDTLIIYGTNINKNSEVLLSNSENIQVVDISDSYIKTIINKFPSGNSSTIRVKTDYNTIALDGILKLKDAEM